MHTSLSVFPFISATALCLGFFFLALKYMLPFTYKRSKREQTPPFETGNTKAKHKQLHASTTEAFLIEAST